MAALSESTVDEINGTIDLWMSDREGDSTTLLQHLGIKAKTKIKCSANVILIIDHACNKVFRNMEQKIGVQKLLHLSADGKVFASPSTSIQTLAQIEIRTLLSPSHAAHSISLYNDYKNVMDVQAIKHNGFKVVTVNLIVVDVPQK